jgi:hypothetical protein
LISAVGSLCLSIPALPVVTLADGFPPAPSPSAGVRVAVVADGLHDPPGLVFWSDAETHEVENVSGRDMRSLIVELKSLPA